MASAILGSHRESFHEKTVVEFGAAAGLPSICAIESGARFVCSTDFPAKNVLATLQKNIHVNVRESQWSQLQVVDHKWGEDVQPLLNCNEAHGGKFDIAIAAECLWKHDCHDIFLQSLSRTLKSSGLAFITFSHHIPGLEGEDISFFEKAKLYGFVIVAQETVCAPHMWSDRIVDVFLYTLRLTPEISV